MKRLRKLVGKFALLSCFRRPMWAWLEFFWPLRVIPPLHRSWLLKMISSPYCAVSEPNVYKHYKRLTRWNANRCYSLLKNHIPYLWDLSNSFSNSFIDFYSCEGFHQVIYQEEWSIKLPVENGCWHESLNLLHVSRCEMLHFVTSYMKQNKSRKQTLESAQSGLEISFKQQVWQ